MRDVSAIQRRRRLLKFNNEPDVVENADLDSTGAIKLGTQLFADCRGQANAKLVIEVPGEAHARDVSLDRPGVIIGSDPACDIVIHHKGVLPRHAYLQWIDGRIFCCSLSGYEQSKLAGFWIGRKPVMLGSLRLSVQGIDESFEASDPLVPSAELSNEIPQVHLKFSAVQQRDNLWPVDRRLTLIGRGADCRLRLADPRVTPVLASLIRTPTSCWLIDLSRYGQVAVNGDETHLASLDIGDTIRLGPFVAEVSTRPFSLKTPRSAVRPDLCAEAIRELTDRQRQQLDSLNQSLETVNSLLTAKNLDAAPKLKAAWQQYVSQAKQHQHELLQALKKLSGQSE